MIDFEIPTQTARLRDEISAFVTEHVVGYETDPRMSRHGPNEELRNELVGLARNAGLLTFQAPRRFGGREPSHAEQAILFEAAGWSTLGPVALNCAAPDEGNMFLLTKIADEQQVEQFLVPVIEGRQRSVFAMTEPGGAGSDPNQLATEAVFDGRDYVINGLKWLITGANGARTWIIMARVRTERSRPGGSHAVSVRRTHTGDRTRARDEHDGPQLRRGPRSRSFQRLAAAFFGRARRGRPGASLRPATADARPAHALHALARCGVTCAVDSHRTRPHPNGFR